MQDPEADNDEGNAPLDPLAIGQLDALQRRLLDAIDSLRCLEKTEEIPLPQLVVVGHQNSGKSSTLESISRVRFAVHGSAFTRFPTELILRRSPAERVDVSIINKSTDTIGDEPEPSYTFTRSTFDPERLPELIRDAEIAMGIRKPKQRLDTPIPMQFTGDALRIEISGPKQPHLTLVDLPGLYESESVEQSNQGRREVERIVNRYMKQSRSIILAIVSGTSDPTTQVSPRKAKKFDKDQERILGVITRPDGPQSDGEKQTLVRCANNELITFKHGWHSLKNRSEDDRTNGKTNEERDAAERDFFERPPWDVVPDENKGIDALRQKLSRLLLNRIKSSLPKLIHEAEKAKKRRVRERAGMGEPLVSYRQQRNYLSPMARRFELLTSQALDGIYSDSIFGTLRLDEEGRLDEERRQDARLRANIRELNRLFGRAMLESGRTFDIRPEGTRYEFEEGSVEENDSKHEDATSEVLSDQSQIRDRIDPNCGKQEHHKEPMSKMIPEEVVTKYYRYEEVNGISRPDLEFLIQSRVGPWKGCEAYGDTNSALTRQSFRMQAQPWDFIVRNHADALWFYVEKFVKLALQDSVDDGVRPAVIRFIVGPALDRLRKRFSCKKEEILRAHRNVHPSQYDGLINIGTLTQTSQSLATRLGAWAQTTPSVDWDGKDLDRTGPAQSRVHGVFPSEIEEFSAARTVDLMSLCMESLTISLVNSFAIMAVENCLVEGLRTLFTDITIGDVSKSTIASIAGESQRAANRRKQLDEEIRVLSGALDIFHQYQGTDTRLDREPVSSHLSDTEPDSGRSSYRTR